MKLLRFALNALAALAVVAPVQATLTRTELLSEMPQILEGAQDRASRGQLSMANSYLDLILLQKPIRVAVNVDPSVKARRPELIDSIRQAVWKWEKALDNSVRFVFISDARRAEVKVNFAGKLPFNSDHTTGHCDYVREIVNGQARVRATLHVLTKAPSGNDLGFAEIRHTSMHELGHVLGLEDNPEVGTLMGPLQIGNPVHEIDPQEISALHDLRFQALQMRQTNDQRLFALKR